jgi:hypothetical protein
MKDEELRREDMESCHTTLRGASHQGRREKGVERVYKLHCSDRLRNISFEDGDTICQVGLRHVLTHALCACVRVERGDGEGQDLETLCLVSDKVGHKNLADVGIICQVGCSQQCTCE